MIGHVLVICVGNICRSPMAEALLRDALRGKIEITIESAGLGAVVGHPAEGHAVDLMQQQGIDITAHRARQVKPDMISNADLILVMEAGHKKVVVAMDATVRAKVFRLGEWRDTNIADPYRQPKAAFAQALEEIRGGVADWNDRLTRTVQQ